MKRIIYLVVALICAVSINAQVTIGADSDPHGGAVLELKSTNKGLLLPRVSLSNVATYGLSGTASSATGMVVYNTNANITNGNGVGVYVWDGSKWGQIGNSNGSGDNGNSTPTECGAWLNAAQTQWLAFQCYNLGATENGAPFTPAAAIHGAKYQWGRNTPTVTQAVDQANSGAISGWNSTAASDYAWSDASKTTNDPCPNGWRVPTSTQWSAFLANNAILKIGTWSTAVDDYTNYSSGMKIGDVLFLPAAGSRGNVNNGQLGARGNAGYYGSSTMSSSNNYYLVFTNSIHTVSSTSRLVSTSIRCVAE